MAMYFKPGENSEWLRHLELAFDGAQAATRSQ